MKGYKDYFKGKKITMLGLGLLGRGLGDAKFLAECGADLIVTDLKTKEDLAPTLKKLAKYTNITYTLGEHKLEDFRNRDFILKAAGVPLNSPYIEEARKNNIPVEMEGSLFAKLADSVTFVGITGTRGKTTTTYIIYEILKTAFPGKVYLGGNIRGVATLPMIKKVKAGDIMVMELDSWQLQGWGEAKTSPHISVFTNFLDDHLNYYVKGAKDEAEAVQRYFDDKANIFRSQKKNDFLIVSSQAKKIIAQRYDGKPAGKVLVPSVAPYTKWKLKIKGEHNLTHIAQAVEVARKLGVTEKVIRKIVEDFPGVAGRLEFIRYYKSIDIYNDTTATTPDATLVALASLKSPSAHHKNIVLITGGADKGLDMTKLVKEIPKTCRAVILLAGTGTERIRSQLPNAIITQSLKEALQLALGFAKKGDSIVLSPAFASFGMFKNEYDRGDQFVQLVKKLR